MKYNKEILTFNKLNTVYKFILDFVLSKDLNLIIVGSVSYRDIFKNKSNNFNDFDIVIVFDDINKLKDFPYLSKSYFEVSKEKLYRNEIDIFSIKFYLEKIQVSMDFIPLSYLKILFSKSSTGNSNYLIKLNDSKEKKIISYYNTKKESIKIQKVYSLYKDYYTYTLPNFIKGSNVDNCFIGVFISKFLDKPTFSYIFNKDIKNMYKYFLKNFHLFYYKN